MTFAITWSSLHWDAAKAIPDGPTSDHTTQTFERFTDEYDNLIAKGARLVATLPMSEPGQAFLLFRQVTPMD